MLDVLNLAAIAKFSNRESLAFATSAASTANPVHVIFSFHRQAVVDDVRDGWDVQTPGCDVGGDENLHTAVAKRHQAAIAQTLAQCTVESHSAETFLHQIVGQSVAFNLGTCKNNRLIDGGIAQHVVQQLAFVGHVVGPQQ